jgi:hypothetical protein
MPLGAFRGVLLLSLLGIIAALWLVWRGDHTHVLKPPRIAGSESKNTFVG